jgi:hypothetical protein
MFAIYINCTSNLAGQMLSDTVYGSQAQKLISAAVQIEMSEKDHKVSTKNQ